MITCATITDVCVCVEVCGCVCIIAVFIQHSGVWMCRFVQIIYYLVYNKLIWETEVLWGKLGWRLQGEGWRLVFIDDHFQILWICAFQRSYRISIADWWSINFRYYFIDIAHSLFSECYVHQLLSWYNIFASIFWPNVSTLLTLQ